MDKLTFNKFKRKQDRLRRALIKVKTRLIAHKQYAEQNFYKPYDSLSEEERQKQIEIMNSFNWNDLHDLEDRLKERYKDNYFSFQQYSFDTVGIAIF